MKETLLGADGGEIRRRKEKEGEGRQFSQGGAIRSKQWSRKATEGEGRRRRAVWSRRGH